MNFAMTYRGQSVRVAVKPEDSVWDAVQVTTTLDERGNERGRGDFDVDGKRIFAEDMRAARMIARRI